MDHKKDLERETINLMPTYKLIIPKNSFIKKNNNECVIN